MTTSDPFFAEARARHRQRACHAACVVAWFAACGGCSDEAAGNPDAATFADAEVDANAAADSGGARALFGSFVVKLIAPADGAAGYTSFLGKLFDGPQPPLVPLVLDSEQGDCQLLVPDVPFCDPDCGQDACTADGECTPFPQPQSAGEVRVLGLGDEELALEPVGSSLAYMPAASLPYPPCAEGEPVRVQAAAFELETECIAPLEVTETDAIPVRSGEPARVTWTAADEPGARVRLVLDIAHHGGQKGEIDCLIPDSGSFEIPEPLVTKLVSLGVAGFPTIVISRVSTGASEARPELTLSVASEVERAVDTGVLSCGSDPDCPQGMTCDRTTLICVE